VTPVRGIVLAGGLGTRLLPMTRAVNKHVLPVYDRPMIYYPLDALRGAGVEDACVVVGGRATEDVRELIQDGQAWGFRRLEYAVQAGQGGIADALRCARSFAGDAPICVILGDNIVQEPLQQHAARFIREGYQAMVLLARVGDPERFGVPEFGPQGEIRRIVEKPALPASNHAVTGVYFYRPDVFGVIDQLRPSARGEMEITDVNNVFASRGTLGWAELTGFWADAGTADGLFRASALVREQRLGPSASSEVAAAVSG